MGATLHVAPTLEELSRQAAGFVVRSCQSAVHAAGRCALALSGGSTPSMLYGLLAHPPYAGQMPWGQLHFFWSDERCVPSHDTLSNYHLAEQRLLSLAPVPRENVHRAPVELEDPEAIALAYAEEIRRFFRLGP
ncbi:MAG: 6-phosphogluconolactonase, partial [Chloroflexi bacterium]|nr:6-phosphogluconolactonase [Chloroflexota bacterium]